MTVADPCGVVERAVRPLDLRPPLLNPVINPLVNPLASLVNPSLLKNTRGKRERLREGVESRRLLCRKTRMSEIWEGWGVAYGKNGYA